MSKISLAISLILSLLLTALSSPMAADSLRLATPIKMSPHYYLPIVAAEEKGFWRGNALEVEWVPFTSDAAFHRAIAAGAAKAGIGLAATLVRGAGVGVPMLIIAGLHPMHTWYLWVRAESRLRQPSDLKEARVGVSRLGGMEQAYGEIVASGLGLKGQVKFVGAGGITENIAMLRAGHVDTVIFSPSIMIKLKLAGVVRELLAVNDFLPKEWAGYFLFTTPDLAEKNPSLTQRLVKASLQATAFLKHNPAWALEKMKAFQGFSAEEAKAIQATFNFINDGKITREGLEQVREFLIQYGIVARERTPPVDSLFTEQFLK